MDKVLNRRSLLIGVPGLLMQIVGQVVINVVADSSGDSAGAALVALGGLGLILVGTVLLIAGLAFYAQAKGYSWVFGFLGLCSCLGLIILAALPDKLK